MSMHAVNRLTPFTHFAEDDLNCLSEEEIVCGLKLKNQQITQKYFYGFCQKAYFTWNKKYQFMGKEGLDFYTLSNDYYLRMVMSNWKSLEVDRKSAKLSTWIVGGFWHTVLNSLREYNKQQELHSKFVSTDDCIEKISNLADNFCISKEFDWSHIREYVLVDKVNRTIFDKYIIQGYKMKEIAAELQMTPSAVSQRYKDIVKSIARYYKKDSYGKE